MENITNIDKIIFRYYEAWVGLDNRLKEVVKGDWSRAEFVYNNDELFRKLYKEMLDSLKNFEQVTSANMHTCSDNLSSIYNKLIKVTKDSSNECSINGFLEHIREEWEGKIGDIDHAIKIVESLGDFFKLPNYDPDGWLKRKFILRGVYIPVNKVKNINKTVVQGFHESCSCFIYGNYLATIAMARSVLEFSLRDKFKEFCNRTLDEIINKIWNSVPALKNKDNYRAKADFIRITGNDVLHKDDIKRRQLINEHTTLIVLSYLKELIKFIYK